MRTLFLSIGTAIAVVVACVLAASIANDDKIKREELKLQAEFEQIFGFKPLPEEIDSYRLEIQLRYVDIRLGELQELSNQTFGEMVSFENKSITARVTDLSYTLEKLEFETSILRTRSVFAAEQLHRARWLAEKFGYVHDPISPDSSSKGK